MAFHNILMKLSFTWFKNMYTNYIVLDCCWAHSTLWLDESDNTRLMVVSLGHMVTWWRVHFALRSNCMPGTVFQKESSCLQTVAELFSKILKASTVNHLWGSARDTDSIPTCRWHYKSHWICWVIWPQWQNILHSSLHLLQSLLWFFTPLKTSSSLSHSVGKWTRLKHLSEECVASKYSKRSTMHCGSFLVVVGARGNKLFFTLEGIFLHDPHTTRLRNFTEVERP